MFLQRLKDSESSGTPPLLPLASGDSSDCEASVGSAEPSASEDGVHLYLKAVGAIPLLNRDDEVRLARNMERGNRRVRKALSRTPWLWTKINSLHQKLSKNPSHVRRLIDLETSDRAGSTKERAKGKLREKFARVAQLFQEFEKLAARKRSGRRPSLAVRRKHAWRQARCKVALSRASRDIPFRLDVWKAFAAEFLDTVQIQHLGILEQWKHGLSSFKRIVLIWLK